MTNTRKKKAKKATVVKAWGGFSDGKLSWWSALEFTGATYSTTRPAIYPTRKMARKEYQDVRRVVISEVL